MQSFLRPLGIIRNSFYYTEAAQVSLRNSAKSCIDPNTDNEDSEIVKDFADLDLVINSNGSFSQEFKRRLNSWPKLPFELMGRAAMGESGEIAKSKEGSLETKAKTTHTSYSQLLCVDGKVGR